MYGQRSVQLYDPQDANSWQWSGSLIGRDVGHSMTGWHNRFNQEENQAQAQAKARQAEMDNMARAQYQAAMENNAFQKKMQEQQASQQAENSKQRNEVLKTLAFNLGGGFQPYRNQGSQNQFGAFRTSLMN